MGRGGAGERAPLRCAGSGHESFDGELLVPLRPTGRDPAAYRLFPVYRQQLSLQLVGLSYLGVHIGDDPEPVRLWRERRVLYGRYGAGADLVRRDAGTRLRTTSG